MTKNQLVKLIHIAKSQLKLDDDTYRQLLVRCTKKESCSKMLKHELEKVYDEMKSKGFEYSGFKKKQGKPAVAISRRRDDIRKIKAVWITMGQHGFIENPSNKALDAYVERMTKTVNDGIGIKTVAWLDVNHAHHVLEAIKKWHLRCIFQALEKVPNVIIHNGKLLINGEYYRGYEVVARFYADILQAKKQFKGNQ